MALKQVTDASFVDDVLNQKGVVVVDFWAPWCGPCRMVAPIVEEIARERNDIKVGKVNVDEQPELAKLFGIESIPTIVLVQNRRTLTGFVGAREKEDLTKLVESCLA